jgi:hypothetical protein
VPEDVPQTVAEVFSNLIGHSGGTRAEGALEVRVLHKCHGSRSRAEDVVARRIHRPGEGRGQPGGGLPKQHGGQAEHHPTERGGQPEGE